MTYWEQECREKYPKEHQCPYSAGYAQDTGIIRKRRSRTASTSAGQGWAGQESPHVPEEYNAFVVALFFMMLIGCWIMVNALIDLAAKRFRIWVSDRWHGET